jgi:aspartyl-tRNA(Asn)/glutamyl-tRNA(Gln) amidotransferase subunit A
VHLYASIEHIQAALKDGQTQCQTLVAHYLEEIASQSQLNAFLHVYHETAMEKARIVDLKVQQGTAGRLAGLVLAVKDNICYAHHPLQAASKILHDFRSLYTATALQRLLNEDAIIIGSTNCDEFAMGSSNENSAFGPVRNPLDPTLVPGGSSGGSAAAVAGGLCHASLGSDTGGSIRQPASFCGLYGLKPTYGRISRYGLIAYGSSFDQIGPLTHSLADLALLTEIMAGPDASDNTSCTTAVQPYSRLLQQSPTAPKRIGIIQETIDSPGLDPEIRNALATQQLRLEQMGHTVEMVSFPYLEYLIPIYYILSTAEASSNLARFDGVRYGYRSEAAGNMDELYVRSRTEGFGPEVKRRIMLGTFVLSSGYYDAYYQKAQRIRRLLVNATQALLADVDFILSPTTPTTAFALNAKSDDPISMYLSDIFTVHANLTGHPALSIPVGQHSNGMPFGMHLLGRYFDEAELFSFAQQMTH